MSFISGLDSLQRGGRPVAPSETKPVQAIAREGQVEGTVADLQHGDQTQLSSTGGLVAQALESSDVRTAKVAALQQAISTGTYNVPSSGVAKKIIQSLLE
jgi:negative regulator of flagellin synthesis FlgM